MKFFMDASVIQSGCPWSAAPQIFNVSDFSQGVLSNSENEEPISRRIRNISAFVRKTKSSSAFTG